VSLTDKEKKERKRCTKCEKTKPLPEFYKRKNGKLGLESQCKVCKIKRRRQYYKDNDERLQQYGRQYYENNKEVINQRQKRYWATKYCEIKEAMVTERYCKYVCNENVKEFFKTKNRVFCHLAGYILRIQTAKDRRRY